MKKFTLSGLLLLTFVSCNQNEAIKSPTFDRVRPNTACLPMKQLSTAIVRVQPSNTSTYDILTPMPIAEVSFEQGLLPEAIVGRYKELVPNLEQPGNDVETGIGPEDLIVNSVFIDFLHDVISKNTTEVTDYQLLAKKINNGWLYLIDGRTDSSAAFVPIQDILGAFMVRNGSLIENSYHRNSQYVVDNENGFMTLHEALCGKLIDELLVLYEK